jgi:hypothetical protein
MVAGVEATVFAHFLISATDTGFPWLLARYYHIRVEILRINFCGKTYFVADKKAFNF